LAAAVKRVLRLFAWVKFPMVGIGGDESPYDHLIAKVSLKIKKSSKIFGRPPPGLADFGQPVGLEAPGQHRPVMVRQGKG